MRDVLDQALFNDVADSHRTRMNTGFAEVSPSLEKNLFDDRIDAMNSTVHHGSQARSRHFHPSGHPEYHAFQRSIERRSPHDPLHHDDTIIPSLTIRRCCDSAHRSDTHNDHYR